MKWLKPTKKSIITFIALGIIYSYFTFSAMNTCTAIYLDCSGKPSHGVPGIFPGARGCQICATNPELIKGYMIMILTSFIVPFIVIYLLSSLLNLKRNSK